MGYELLFSDQVLRVMRKMPAKTVDEIIARLRLIAEDPFAYHPAVTRLQNRAGYRLRVGDWRVIYDIQQKELVVRVIKVGTRGEIYR